MTVLFLVLLVIFPGLVWLFYWGRRRTHLPESPDTEPGTLTTIPDIQSVDMLLVGAGAMSTTLGMLLLQLDPSLRICLVEKLGDIAQESTDALNNAGTGHAGHCELNYTPEADDGTINTKKALLINSYFEESLQFWSYLVEEGLLPTPNEFIRQVPHFSLVHGKEDVDFLRRRHALLSKTVAFGDMEFTTDHAELRKWFPLIMKDQPPGAEIAATRVRYGTDVDFGALARCMAKTLDAQESMDIRTHRTLVDLRQQESGQWRVELHNTQTQTCEVVLANKVFLGAGGGALPLLQKSGIPEGKGYGGFPVSGQWLICNKPSIVDQHWGKVYGKAGIGAPPMSVPHLDTRCINGEQCLLFGPFAGFSTKYLKQGSFWDLPNSITADNLKAMVVAGLNNIPLTRYLINEVSKSQKARMKSLRHFYRNADDKDWRLEVAGQRVQIIKTTPGGGKLEFGTEVVSSADSSLAALLGASPGASTATHVMLDVIARCFPERIAQDAWKSRLQEMIPSYGQDLLANDDLFRQVRKRNNATLQIDALDHTRKPKKQ